MKKAIRYIICSISVILMLISLFHIAITMTHGNIHLSAAEEVTETYTSVDIGNAQYTFVNDNFIYIASTDSNIVQIFSLNGNYIKGLLIPSGGGEIWMGTNANHELCIYSVRKNLQIILSGDTYTTHENVYYINENSFYEKSYIVNSDFCKRNKNIVFLNDGNSIKVDAPARLYSLGAYISSAVLSFLAFIIASGLLAKMTENSRINIPLSSKNKLK